MTEDKILISWRDLRDWVFLLPVFHLALCFTFLLFYSFGFRSFIETFYSASDVFTLSFREIAPGYLALAAILPISSWISGPLVAAREATGAVGMVKSPIYIIMHVALIVIAVLLTIVSFMMYKLYFLLTGLYSVAATVILLLVVPTVKYGLESMRGKLTFTHSAVSIILFPLFVAAFSGAYSGERDIAVDWHSARTKHPICGDFAVLRSFGDRFLAVGKDSAKVMLSEDCQRRFVFASPIQRGLARRASQVRATSTAS